MQKKRNIQLKLSDIAAVLICTSAMAVCLFFFFNNINKELVKNSEDKIATITFKYRSAQRKFSDGVIWDKLRNNSAVYNGDTIRTASSSEATVFFESGNSLDLHENTLAQIYTKKKEGEISILFDRGNLSLQTINDAQRVTIESSKGTITIDSKTSLSVSIHESIQKVQVLEGNAEVVSGNKAVVLSTGDSIETSDTPSVLEEPSVTMIEPIQNYKRLNHSGELTHIIFRWKTSNMPSDARLFLDLYTDKRLSTLYKSFDVTDAEGIDTALSNGMFYWKLYPVLSDASVKTRYDSGQLLILDAPSPSIITPKDTVFEYDADVPQIRFMWKGNDWVSLYQVEVADNSEMINPTAVKTSSSESCFIGNLTEGKWYWRIVPIYTIQKTDSVFSSDVHSFSLVKNKPESIPVQMEAVTEQVTTAVEAESEAVQAVPPVLETSSSSASTIPQKKTSADSGIKTKETGAAPDSQAVNTLTEKPKAPEPPQESTIVFEKTEIVAPKTVFNEVALEQEDTDEEAVDISAETEPPKVLIKRITSSSKTQATKALPLTENDYSDSFSWRAWSDISSGGKSTASVNTVEVLYKDSLFAGVQLAGNVKQSSVKQYGLSLYMSNMDIPSSLRKAKNIKFKLVGDGNEYSVRFGTSNTGDQYECRFATQAGIVMEFDIPYYMFKQFSGKKITAFAPDQISSFSFAPVSPKPGSYKLTVFDINPY